MTFIAVNQRILKALKSLNARYIQQKGVPIELLYDKHRKKERNPTTEYKKSNQSDNSEKSSTRHNYKPDNPAGEHTASNKEFLFPQSKSIARNVLLRNSDLTNAHSEVQTGPFP